MSDASEKDFKVAIINMFIDLKESMIKKINESMMTMSHQIKKYQQKDRNYVYLHTNINVCVCVCKHTHTHTSQMETLELKSAIAKIKNVVETQ